MEHVMIIKYIYVLMEDVFCMKFINIIKELQLYKLSSAVNAYVWEKYKYVVVLSHPLTWASGLPVAIQCAWNLDPSVHWNTTGEMIVGSQCASRGLPVAFQWSSSVFQLCKLTLDRHWVLASASVVPVASQCACGSSGLPVCSNYAN